MPIEAGFKGAQELIDKLLERADRTPQDVGRALYVHGEKVMTVSKRDHVPKRYGVLAATGVVEQPVITLGARGVGNEVTVRLSFGGPAAPYAEAVHEHPSEHDPPSWVGVEVRFNPPGHGPKYLEIPMLAAADSMVSELARELGLGG